MKYLGEQEKTLVNHKPEAGDFIRRNNELVRATELQLKLRNQAKMAVSSVGNSVWNKT